MKLATCLLRLPAVLLALPLAASATIYKWTDERGTTVFSNRQPAAEAKVSNMQVVVEDDEPARAPKQVPAPKPDNGNALQERVRALEQQVQALQSQPSAQPSIYPAPSPAQLPPASYYPPPASYYPPPDYYPPPSYPSSMYGWGDSNFPYAYPPFGYASFGFPTIVVTGRRFFPPFVRPVPHKFFPHHFAVRPVPVTGSRTMGVSHAMGGGRRR